MSESLEDKLPAFVSPDGDGYKLDRKRAWLWAIVFPFIMWGAGFLIVAVVIRPSFNSSWYPSSAFTLGALVCMSLGLSIAGVLKQQRAVDRGLARLPWHQFSLLELIVYTTGFTIGTAILAAQQGWLSS